MAKKCDVKKMSEETGISVEKIEGALSSPPETDFFRDTLRKTKSSVEAVLEVYSSLMSNSDGEKEVIHRLSEFFMDED